jgi:peptide/nickel transport system permease protein
MLQYALKRLGMAVAVMLLVVVFLASMANLAPGDPVKAILGPRASEELSRQVREEMGLDKPIPVQVWDFVADVLRGDLGRDFVTNRSVVELIGLSLPHTLLLAVFSVALSAVIGIPLGAFAATRPNTWVDRLIAILSVSFVAMPQYVAALLLLLVFAVRLSFLPAIGAGELSDPLDYLRHLILPSGALAITFVGYLARLVRGSVLEVLNANYIRSAFAFGLSDRLIVYKYALKNAIIPTVALLGVALGAMMGGAVFIEVIFARPGLGFLIYNAVIKHNYPIVRGGTLVAALAFVVANLIVDLSYRYLDPRIEIGEGIR